jgi:threonine dehydrogenase-like Zn-dependent dehydrogenase
MSSSPKHRVTLIGAGTIGILLPALHLAHLHSSESLTIVDTRPDLAVVVEDQLNKIIPKHLGAQISKIDLTTNLTDAVKEATIVQVSGPEDLYFKQSPSGATEEVPGHKRFASAGISALGNSPSPINSNAAGWCSPCNSVG